MFTMRKNDQTYQFKTGNAKMYNTKQNRMIGLLNV